MTWIDWYNSLAKPSWTPAPPTIGLIWQILYPIILTSFSFVFVQMFRGKVSWMVALPFAIMGSIDTFEIVMFGNGSGNGLTGASGLPTGQREIFFDNLLLNNPPPLLPGDFNGDGTRSLLLQIH